MSMLNLFTCVKSALFITALVLFTGCQAKEKITIHDGDLLHVFYVDVAQTSEEQAQGLMFVDEMRDDHGMIFLFDHPQIMKFWMKNTLIPLDMLFFDDQNKLIHIEYSADPGDLRPRGPNIKVCSVIELNGGTAQQLKIQKGAKLITNFAQECLQNTTK